MTGLPVLGPVYRWFLPAIPVFLGFSNGPFTGSFKMSILTEIVTWYKRAQEAGFKVVFSVLRLRCLTTHLEHSLLSPPASNI